MATSKVEAEALANGLSASDLASAEVARAGKIAIQRALIAKERLISVVIPQGVCTGKSADEFYANINGAEYRAPAGTGVPIELPRSLALMVLKAVAQEKHAQSRDANPFDETEIDRAYPE
jgi:hypothetical protein